MCVYVSNLESEGKGYKFKGNELEFRFIIVYRLFVEV